MTDPRDRVITTARGREVRIEYVRGLAVDWIVVRTPICTALEMDLEQVLERQARLAFASIVLAHDVYWLRIALPTDSAELAAPARVVELVAAAAESLVPRFELLPDVVNPFEHLAS